MDNNDDYVSSDKEDVEIGIFIRKICHLNNDDEKIKKRFNKRI